MPGTLPSNIWTTCPFSGLLALASLIDGPGSSSAVVQGGNGNVKPICWLWEAIRDRGPYWSRISSSFFKKLTSPLFGDLLCHRWSTAIPTESSYIPTISHCQNHNKLIPQRYAIRAEVRLWTFHWNTTSHEFSCHNATWGTHTLFLYHFTLV